MSLCAQMALAQTNADGAARLQSFSGRISVMRDTTSWALKTGDTVQPLQVIVTGPDGYGVFKVGDGSTFEVFPDSRVVFRANRGDWRDLLEVWIGKVRVQIEHLGGLPNHNKVYTPSAVISVRGTIFDVQVEDEDATTLVLDEEGSVEVRHLLRPGEPKVLAAGEYVRVYKNNPLAKKDVDRGAILQRFGRAAAEAIYQAAVNASRPGTTGATTTTPPTTNSGDKNTVPTPPPPPPPPPTPPPPPPH
jgi:ferric-dicitrate binding protein FerR (iron transport regulator)